ncbi:MAG: hypothetical protein ACO2O4_00090 [Minisyncoccia bacterium]|jgi:uncharacterized coiled-coil DUF342 family protein
MNIEVKDIIEFQKILEDVKRQVEILQKERDYYREEAIKNKKLASELEEKVNSLLEELETYKALYQRTQYVLNPKQTKLASDFNKVKGFGNLEPERIWEIINSID